MTRIWGGIRLNAVGAQEYSPGKVILNVLHLEKQFLFQVDEDNVSITLLMGVCDVLPRLI